MTILTDYLLPALFAFAACLGFCVTFNVRGFGAVICSAGGGLAWLVYLLAFHLSGNPYLANFWAAVFLSLYSEVMARIRKCPVTGYMLVAFLPLVPGAGIYQMMAHALAGEGDKFMESTFHTLSIAGVLAVGVLVVSSLVRMVLALRKRRQTHEPPLSSR